MQPRVSIIIPAYNAGKFIRETLESVIAQTITDWEVIVVNNFSDDDTAAVVASLQDPRIQFVDFRNDGVIAASRNFGVTLAKAELVAFLDADDRWAPRKLEAS